MRALGNKLLILGVSASGKSAFARKLAEKLKLPRIHADAIMWRPGWHYIGDEETAKVLEIESAKPEWIIEGYIVKQARPAVFERADTIIYLHYPRYVAAWRYLERAWKHRKEPRPELPGNPDEFKWETLKKIWNRLETRNVDRFISQMPNQEKVIKLLSPHEADKFLQG